MKITKEDIKAHYLPQHLAIIMDGNGRWAKQKGRLRIFGHENGSKTVRTIVEACAELGIPNLTLYAFQQKTGIGLKKKWIH